MARVAPLLGILIFASYLSGYSAGPYPSGHYKTVYPYSVLPGGLAGVDVELERRTDPVVMQAWAGVHRLSPAALRGGLYYLQYRRGDQVGWTREPRRIPAGEPVMVDQDGSILRVRCGNGISSRPRFPLVPFTPPPVDVPEMPTVTWVDAPGLLPVPSQPVPLLTEELPPFRQLETELPLAPRPPETFTVGGGRIGFPVIPPIFPIGPSAPAIPTQPRIPVPPPVSITPAPETPTFLMLGAGLLSCSLFRWRHR